jgi:hypothetical protein
MSPARVRSLISLLDSTIYCSECNPPVPVEIQARVFYRMRDQDLVHCPNGHQGTMRDYKHAVAHPGERSGPFVLHQHGDTSLRIAGKTK